MATKDLAAQILSRMQSGINDLYESYRRRRTASDAYYDEEIRRVDDELAKEKRRTESAARVRLSGELERLANQGLSASGGAMQARLSQNAALSSAISELNGAAAEKKKTYALEKANAARELEEKTATAVNNARTTLLKTALSQIRAEQKSASSGGAKNEVYTPSVSPYKYLTELVSRYTAKDPDDPSHQTVDKKNVALALKKTVEDPNVDLAYRRELYLYASGFGYFA